MDFIGFGMPCHIGQSFLEDSKQRGGSTFIQSQVIFTKIDITLDSGAIFKFYCLPFDRFRQAEVVQYGRPQIHDQFFSR